jgi:hypothetical protein
MTDADLEQRIANAKEAMVAAETPEDRRGWYEEMRWLISQRSPQRIAEMEEKLPKRWGT